MSIEVFNKMLGQMMTEVSVNSNNDELKFTSSNGKVCKFLHYQNCCESVGIEDICGDLNDLVGFPLLIAEEVDSLENFNKSRSVPEDSYYNNNGTWTFYKFATNKGSMTVRRLGVSNGYYSESVSYEEE